MAKMFITIKIMPESPEIDLKILRDKAKEVSDDFGAELLDKDFIEPVAFGLNALKLIFYLDESKGSEDLADKISSIEGVSSAEVVDMRRAIG
ncbi:elongation factor 1-beta [Candidatus Woesearchaeota archaeon]|nr:elongation factor 1-beta [Candidatus Woesearchaeota archaeon]